MDCAIGLDLGGTKTAAGVVTADGRVLHQATMPTPAPEGARSVLRTATELAAAMGVWADGAGYRVVGCGAGVAGTVGRDGVVTHATEALPGWAGTDVVAALAGTLGLPVRVVNDVHALALGEHRHGAASGSAGALVVAVGTGIGGAVIQDGRLVGGRSGTAGAVGHVAAARPDRRRCPCGRDGHLEAYASGPAILAQYRNRGGTAGTLAAVGAHARDGDPLAHAAVDDAATTLGQVLGGLANLLDPDVIVVGGGVALLGDLLFTPLDRALRAAALPGPDAVEVVPAVLGRLAGVVGAASLAFDPLR